MNVKKMLSNKRTVFMISFLWGMGLAFIIFSKCYKGYCIVIKGPKQKDINDKIFKFEEECYKFKPKITKCMKKESMLKDY